MIGDDAAAAAAICLIYNSDLLPAASERGSEQCAEQPMGWTRERAKRSLQSPLGAVFRLRIQQSGHSPMMSEKFSIF